MVNGFAALIRLLLSPVGRQTQRLDPTPLLRPHYRPSSLLRVSPSQCSASVRSPRGECRDEGLVRDNVIYITLGVHGDGTKDILGIWIENTEGAKFWLRVMNDLKNRGVDDILIAVVDGLKGFPEAINAVFPKAIVQKRPVRG
jgi:hypothetical protein